MSHTKKVGTAGRFGSRYGRKTRFKVNVVETMKNAKQECPKCAKPKIKRIAQGIYECTGCGAKMTGRAYTLNE